MPKGILAACLVGLLLVPAKATMGQALPGTQLWSRPADPAAAMVEGIGRFLDQQLADSVEARQAKWQLDFSSPTEFVNSVSPNRDRFVKLIGAIGERISPVELSYVSSPESPAKLAETPAFTVYAVRWSVYQGVEAEGLLLEPKGAAKANVVVMGDCDVAPEKVVGLAAGLDPNAQTARRLAEGGCRVLVPTLIDRSDEFSGSPLVRMTNLPHREWVYRMAYEAGRHVIGYEVDKVRAAVDWFERPGQPDKPIGVVGHGEGGLIAFYAAAADVRIDAAWVGGYFGPRERVWQEPIYRNVWGLLDGFGDAELTRLIVPRKLLIEACRTPEIAGPPPPRAGRADAASGHLTTPSATQVRAEWERARAKFPDESVYLRSLLAYGLDDPRSPINVSNGPRDAFLDLLGIQQIPEIDPSPITDPRTNFDPRARMKRQLDQLVAYTQALLRTSELRRNAYWSKADSSSPERWEATTESYRRAFWDDWIGRFPEASEPLQAKSVQVLDEPNFTGYAVELPVWPGVVASGVLLLPKDLKPDERRPVVVCQHGLEGRPDEVVNPKIKSVYHSYGAQLADRGYIVYAPQNPYIGHDTFRLLQRRANPLKKSLFAVIVRQHERTLEWLATLPQVDPKRIAFYGLSYGGKTAMRVPSLLKGYCLSICSADFNEWVVKCTNIDRSYSYMYTLEHDMYEFGLSEGFNYAEMAALIAPRPFQVERGHKDGVAPDEWIGYEFAKVKRLYDTLGIGDRTEITYFNGPHEINGKGTFAFLAKHLNWPRGMPD
jgi:dienelactone hydrolase